MAYVSSGWGQSVKKWTLWSAWNQNLYRLANTPPNDKLTFVDELNTIFISSNMEDFEYKEIEDDNFVVVRSLSLLCQANFMRFNLIYLFLYILFK